MTRFRSFDPVAPISDATIADFEPRVPAEVARLWRSIGAGMVGDDGYFRFVDPARAAETVAGAMALPEGATVLFTTALGDFVMHNDGRYFVVKARFGAIDVIEGASFDDLVAFVEDPAQREAAWEWQPYPVARERAGVPGFEQCFGHVAPSVGGPAEPDGLQVVGLAEYLSLAVRQAGTPKVRHRLQVPAASRPDAEAGSTRLVEVGTALFAKLTTDPVLNVLELPDGLGVCLVHAARGGGKIYVAPDESVLFVGSAVDFESGLGAFRDGVRTPLEKFDIDRTGAGA
ncbi:T6SS immunity protein Tdi1 domain-containing protein [Agromyces sp. S2-1-8]|uniref:T6SS immunity protein Tdi1 domain-containing protein n=1 Tax=Agromyces sp. S2-1-8 TaxID=2897180 RepID=UPI001E2FB5B3|nr:T6SS immunity protein Tdi1 domain-containing protein [Agromyces sp. S2-1-8]MCD5346215.1 DUF1851 domain-containing protein [Agromyces sp. S2-1-8]